jgi:hypothetical protein
MHRTAMLARREFIVRRLCLQESSIRRNFDKRIEVWIERSDSIEIGLGYFH